MNGPSWQTGCQGVVWSRMQRTTGVGKRQSFILFYFCLNRKLKLTYRLSQKYTWDKTTKPNEKKERGHDEVSLLHRYTFIKQELRKDMNMTFGCRARDPLKTTRKSEVFLWLLWWKCNECLNLYCITYGECSWASSVSVTGCLILNCSRSVPMRSILAAPTGNSS